MPCVSYPPASRSMRAAHDLEHASLEDHRAKRQTSRPCGFPSRTEAFGIHAINELSGRPLTPNAASSRVVLSRRPASPCLIMGKGDRFEWHLLKRNRLNQQKKGLACVVWWRCEPTAHHARIQPPCIVVTPRTLSNNNVMFDARRRTPTPTPFSIG